MRLLFSAFYWAFAVGTAIPLFVGALLIWAVTAPFDPYRFLLHRYTCWWAQLYLRCLPGCRIQVEGREKIAPGTPYVLVANHQSAADIMALSALDMPFKWTSHKYNFRIPFIGWNMYLNKYIKVEPGHPDRVNKMWLCCREWLKHNVPVLWFPEGTRSFSGELLPFRGGAFRLAAEAGCAVVPIVVDGIVPVYQGWMVSACPGLIRIRVLDPIKAAEAEGSADKLRERVWQSMSHVLTEMREQAAKEEVAPQTPQAGGLWLRLVAARQR